MSTEPLLQDAAGESGECTLFDRLAQLVPPERQAEYYRVLAHTKTLDPDDEMLRILEAMGVLALLTRETPSAIADERMQLKEVLEGSLEQTEAARERMLEYVRVLESRLADLPSELEAGLDPQRIAKSLGESLRQYFLKSGLPDTAQSLRVTATELTSAQKQFTEVCQHMTHPNMGIAAQVSTANDRVVYSVECRAREIDKLLNQLGRHVVRVWLPTIATAAFVIGLWAGIEVESFHKPDIAAPVYSSQTVGPAHQPEQVSPATKHISKHPTKNAKHHVVHSGSVRP
jgi:hypothetical protein